MKGIEVPEEKPQEKSPQFLKTATKGKKPGAYVPKKKKKKENTENKPTKKKAKKWGNQAPTKEEAEKLRVYLDDEGKGQSKPRVEREDIYGSTSEKIDLNANIELDPQLEATASANSGFFSYMQNLTNRKLDAAALKPVLDKFKDHFIKKNVAVEIAEQLCESVSKSIQGKTISSFTRLSTTVRDAMEEALTRILTPKRTIDILHMIQKAKEQDRPMSIVFIGVNGVGKSTSLSKVCLWLLQQKLRVMIAACDTFRSGAIEQLEVHANKLKVPIYSQGYGGDAASIAQHAIIDAKNKGFDVVLIDTAGRMQDNEKLMRSLAKLIRVNDPDLTLFVGEALVGNDSVDQLRGFNRAIEHYSQAKTPRLIDGIILTKFDTVDEKVGAAISMVYTTGQPIVFIGVGQRYTDIRTLNVKHVVNVLLRGS
eukprot:CAMPEP_0168516586 /NCGR_PEP_ID=MMETSP0405-20121227/5493_1 /TAXON_ID=498012 /ORGANISM="Trichosphaerium sp, Strain Am-I-7 wt" /LENGTH=423 /DNA_ID=CAMNT_0008536331 /DNA_START=245 /DNA_END=1516 /DNA_ORIENTATION=+